MESMTQIKKCIKKVSLYQNLWKILVSEAPGCTRGFMGVLWILEDFWHTWENEPLACTRGFMGLS